ncbi:MAG: sugar phosphate nucleotidyltransferase [Planctomycetes bacterium]|nr:sugar phosphate nucleotidyltransferase [Planctomycetota bacterium]
MKSDVPKVLHPVLGQPLLAYPVHAARSVGAARIVVVVRAEHEAPVREAFRDEDDVVTAVQADARGTAHAVLAAREALAGFEGTLLVLLGDAPCVSARSLEALLAEHAERAAALSVLTGEVDEPRGYGRVVRGPDGDLSAIVEEKDAPAHVRAVREINSGTMAFEAPAVWDVLARIQPSAASGELYLTDAIALTRAAGRRAHAVRAATPDEVLGVNDRAQLAQVTAVLRRRINHAHMLNGVTIVDPESTFIDARAVLEHDVRVEPFTVIEGPSRVERGARVGPFARLRAAHIGPDAVVGNFVEVVRTEVGAGAKALHLSYLGDGALGAGVNVGAGTILANWDGARHHRTTVGEGASLGAGTVLVAPAAVGAGARTGAGAVVVRGEVAPGATVVGVPARPLEKEGGAR